MMEALITSWEEYRKVRDALRADKGPVLLTGGVQIHKAQFLAALCREAELGAVDTRCLIGRAVFLLLPGETEELGVREWNRIGKL